MTAAAALDDLDRHYALLRDSVGEFSAAGIAHQYHPDLSPPGWHLGHCVFTEIYWIREVLLGDGSRSRALKSLYVPELSPKTERAAALPAAADLFAWAEQVREEHRRLLPPLLESGRDEPLLRDNFLARFLCEHYAQHYETTRYIHAQRQAGLGDTPDTVDIAPRPPLQDAVTVPAGRYAIGSERDRPPYDNEFPRFTAELATFHIARHPVTNAEYLAFMDGGGYADPAHWSAAGWEWRQRLGTDRPELWRRAAGGGRYAVDAAGAGPLEADAPLAGVSHYEACAFARWAGARLPHEYEWEAAKRSGVLDGDGRIWEWCANPLHPYAGFEAFPYAGYSVPYFDGRHYVLRGGSLYTRPCIRRPSFRNYYEADKRHIHAGLRLAWD